MYLRSTSAIIENLQSDFDGLGVSGESSKLLRLGQQCLERMLDIVTHLQTHKPRPHVSSLSSPVSPDLGENSSTSSRTLPQGKSTATEGQSDIGLPNLPDVPTFEPMSGRRRSKSHTISPPGLPVNPDVKPDKDGTAGLGENFPVFPDVPGRHSSSERYKELPSVPGSTDSGVTSGGPGFQRPHLLVNSQPLSPVEAARLQNQRLLAAYRTRLAATQANRGKTATFNLSLQRRLAENVAVAKSREESLLKKQKDRNRRLQQQAAKSLHSSPGLTQDELDKRQFYVSVLQFENNSKALLSWRERLKAKPQDVKQIQTLITYLLSVKAHPFTQTLHKYQYATYNRVLPLVDKYASQFECSRDNNNSISNTSNPATGEYPSKGPVRIRTQSADTDSLLNHSQSSSYVGTPETGCLENASFPYSSSQFAPCDRVPVTDAVSLDTKDEGVCDLQNTTEVTGDLQNIAMVAAGQQDSTGVMGGLENTTEVTGDLENITEVMGDLHDTEVVNKCDLGNVGSVIAGDLDHTIDVAAPSERVSPSTETFEVISLSESKQITYIADIAAMEKEALQRHLDNIVGDVHNYLGKLRVLLTVIYEDLDTPEGKDVCYASLEAPFFKPVWGYIIALYRIVHKHKEDALQRLFTSHRHITPADIGVGEKYCLDDGLPSPYSFPYQPAVNELRKITEFTSPLTKLECIVKSSRTICSCVEDHFSRWDKSQSVNIGADDLLPILSYIVLKSELCLLLAESHALEEFIDEGYLMGEEGYCLTSLQTALSYILTLNDEAPAELQES